MTTACIHLNCVTYFILQYLFIFICYHDAFFTSFCIFFAGYTDSTTDAKERNMCMLSDQSDSTENVSESCSKKETKHSKKRNSQLCER